MGTPNELASLPNSEYNKLSLIIKKEKEEKLLKIDEEIIIESRDEEIKNGELSP